MLIERAFSVESATRNILNQFAIRLKDGAVGTGKKCTRSACCTLRRDSGWHPCRKPSARTNRGDHAPAAHHDAGIRVQGEDQASQKKINQEVVVGSTLPEEVELVPVPEAWGPTLRTYHYVYTGDRFYFVEPSSRRVVHIE